LRDAALDGDFGDRYCVELVKVITTERESGLQSGFSGQKVTVMGAEEYPGIRMRRLAQRRNMKII
jgi:hypothetical protein